MLGNQCRVGLRGKIDDLTVAILGHRRHQRIIGIQHADTAGQHHVDLGAQHIAQLFGSLDVVPAEMGACLDIGEDADVATVVGQAFAKMVSPLFSITAASTLRFNRIFRAAAQLALLRPSMRRCARYSPSAQASPTWSPRRCSRLATIRAARLAPCVPLTPTTGMRPSSSAANKLSTTALPTGRALPCAGFKCMSKLGPALISTMAPPCSASGRENILGNEIDTGDIQADDARSQRGRCRHLGMHLVGHVDGHIAVALDENRCSLWRNRIAA